MDGNRKKVTFDSAPAPGVINFGIGQPSADLLPVDVIRAAANDFLGRAHPQELNYGERQGDAGFRSALAGFLSTGYEAPVAPASLFVTCGNSQALDFVCGQFTRPGDTVFIEEPTYFLAHRIFEDHGLEAMGIRPEASHHEVATGQHEIDFRYGPAVTTADSVITFKYVLKAIAPDQKIVWRIAA